MENKKKFYATTSIAYASKTPHIGNTYEVVQTDAIIRHKKLMGYDTYFLTGADEHGMKIGELAEEANTDPQVYVDTVSAEIKDIWETVNANFDQFIRTTDPKHKKVVQKIFKKFYDQGDIYKGTYEGWYCTPCESFYTESQLVDGKCPDCGREVNLTKEDAYFFKMSKYQDRLLKHIEENPDFIVPESRKKEMINNFLKPGLQDLCVSRTSFKWGIPVDFDEGHVVYVWIDALSNYITALGYDPDGSDALYKKYWPADLQVVGKDIVRFHTIYWPIMLMALGEPLPKTVLGHPWLLSGVDKMSKSRGNVIYAKDLVRHFGVDGVRYYLMAEMPFAQDGTITYENVINRYNSDLANTIGNLVNRTVAMTNKYFDGEIKPPGTEEEFDNDLKAVCLNEAKAFIKAMDEYKMAEATGHIMAIANRSNKYIDETMPWALAKDEEKQERLQTVLYNLIEAIRFIAVLSQSIMPDTADKIFDQINGCHISYESLESFGATDTGKKVQKGSPLFERIDEKKKLEEIEQENEDKQKADKFETKAPVQGIIPIEDFAKVALRVAEIKNCEKVKKSDKLLKLTLDDGESGRQVVSGIAEFYSESDLIGKKIIVVANLKPAKLRGELSEGMILAADSKDKVEVIFVSDTIPNGSVVC